MRILTQFHLDKFNGNQLLALTEHGLCSRPVPPQRHAQRRRLRCHVNPMLNMQGRFWINLSSHTGTEKTLPGHRKAEGEWTQMHLLNKAVTLWSQLPWTQRGSPRSSPAHGPPQAGLHFVAEHRWIQWICPSISLDPRCNEILAMESIRSFCSNWRNVQVGAHGHLMHFQGTISLMYFQVCCGYLSFTIKLLKII